MMIPARYTEVLYNLINNPQTKTEIDRAMSTYPLYVGTVDKEYNIYLSTADHKPILDNQIRIKLTNSKIYRNYVYLGNVSKNKIEGHIIQEKSPIWSWNIYILILVIVLSEILIFPYAIGALVFHFKCRNIIYELDSIMLGHGYQKITFKRC